MGQKPHVQRLVDADYRHKLDVAQRMAAGFAVDQLGHYDGCAEKHGEKWLLDLYGNEYAEYKKRVNRCISWQRR